MVMMILVTSINVEILFTNCRTKEKKRWKLGSDNSHSCPRITVFALNVIDH